MTRQKRSYADYVASCAKSNPCLEPLVGLLEHMTTLLPPRICTVDFQGPEPCKVAESSLADVVAHVDSVRSTSGSATSASGRVIIVEDIDAQALQALGGCLDIDPFFFADYFLTDFQGIENGPQPPALALLPSRAFARNIVHLHYQDVLRLEGAAKHDKLETRTNVKRLLRVPRPLGESQPVFLRGCCSAMLRHFDHGSWICLVLVDRDNAELGFQAKSASSDPMRLGIVSFQGGPEGFLDHGPFSDWYQREDSEVPPNTSLLKSLVWHLERRRPPGLHAKNPNLVSLVYYPLKEISSKFMLYVQIIDRYSRFFEYLVERRMNETLDTDIHDLYLWRRRAGQSAAKVGHVIKFISANMVAEEEVESFGPLLADYRHVAAGLEANNQILEFVISLTTAMVQISMARQAIAESGNIRRLTYVALVFAPLGLVAALLSMSDEFLPGHPKFWVYCMAAACVVVLVTGVSLVTDSTNALHLRGKQFFGRKQSEKGVPLMRQVNV